MTEAVLADGSIFRYNIKKTIGGTMHSHHYHDYFEIYYMESGRCSYFIDGKCFEVGEGDIILIPAGVIHRTNYGSEQHSRILIECSYDYIPHSVASNIQETGYLFRNPAVSEEVLALLQGIEKEYKHHDEFSPELIRAKMTELFVRLARGRSLVRDALTNNPLVERSAGVIKRNFNQDIKLSDVARENFVSPEHLSRVFKRDTGFGFNEYLTLVRLQHAEQMLKAKDKRSISEIAFSCGFNDSNYFSDKFKRAYGTSPLKYRKEHK
ncbi:MAG: AraC family transcriptional regulator [Clostridia bacterium]|nr:AraC family transcriptional regulator [Clostridia bacterium]